MWESAAPLLVAEDQRRVLEGWRRAPSTPQGVALRASVILMAADGVPNRTIAKTLGVSRPTVLLWRERFARDGPKALTKIEKGRGRKPSIPPEKVRAIIEATLHRQPPGATHWSCRTMAKAMGVSPDTVNRIWRAHELQPHRVTSFKLSNDPRFVEKLTDVVGLYLNPPEHAIVLCVDEKSQIQALDRTQPGLPLKKGRGATMTHDYKRNGTATLFAALNTLDGAVIGMCQERHRHQEWLKFLRVIDDVTPDGKQIYLIADNYATHKHAKVQRWLKRHPRFHVYFTPTSASWLNMVERFFRDLTQNRLRRGVFRDVEELIMAIEGYIDKHNENPKPFIWTAKATDILEKVKRARKALNNVQSV